MLMENQTDLANKVMTRDQVMEFFGIRRNTVYVWIRAGILPAPIRIGRRSVWFKESIDKTLEMLRLRSEAHLAKISAR